MVDHLVATDVSGPFVGQEWHQKTDQAAAGGRVQQKHKVQHRLAHGAAPVEQDVGPCVLLAWIRVLRARYVDLLLLENIRADRVLLP